MRFILVFSLFIFWNLVSAQETEEIQYIKIDESCEAGIEEAKQDIENGKYKLLSYGMVIHQDFEFRKFQINYVREKYGVIFGDGGCVISHKIICYSETMEKAILEKFGQDFFKRSESEAKEAYYSQSK